MEFSKEQQEAYNKYIAGKNIFITVFLINASLSSDELACVSLQAELDDKVFEIREVERQGEGN